MTVSVLVRKQWGVMEKRTTVNVNCLKLSKHNNTVSIYYGNLHRKQTSPSIYVNHHYFVSDNWFTHILTYLINLELHPPSRIAH